MLYKIQIKDKPGTFDAIAEGIKKDILDFGIKGVRKVGFVQVYILEGNLSEAQAERISDELLADKVSQSYSINVADKRAGKDEFVVEVAYNQGVMDPVEESTLKAIRDLGIEEELCVRTARKYFIKGRLTDAQLKRICEKLLYNKLIQHIVRPNELSLRSRRASAEAISLLGIAASPEPALSEANVAPRNDIYYDNINPGYLFQLSTVELLGASDKKLQKISKQGQLFLNLPEMRQIEKYFKGLKRNPTDCELETIAQTWSEHCWHKTFRGKIEYKEKMQKKCKQKKGTKSDSHFLTKPGKSRLIDNLLRATIMRVTKELDKPWCVSVFKDNAGIIRFDNKNNICFKVETHNHPSALEPFGGANTGVGGVIRDVLGAGLGARPVLNTDVFCFARPDYPFNKLPAGALHPKRIMKGVVSGVRDYGNKMGIPTVNGAILFHDSFVGNPLVYCGTAGIMPKDKCFKKTNTGELIVVVGGKTGRDGIHGATFSSGELTRESETISSGAVQIGNPIQEKKMLDTLLQARDKNLYSALTDCGAGGLSSAVGEMAADLGAEVYLDKVPLKYTGLSYMEIWISESQERMVLSAPKENIDELMKLFNAENVEAAVIGEFTDTGRLKLFYNDSLVCDLDLRFLHKGVPKLAKKAVYIQPRLREPKVPHSKDLTKYLARILSQYDVCSKEWVIRQYDHEVQAGSVLKPLAGVVNDGPSDASVCRPALDSKKGVIVSNGINFRYGFIDPYWMAASCIDEALRQIIAVGGALKETALLDNFCWGNPDKPDRLGGLVRAAYGCYDTAKAFGAPFISGKDSLYNEYTVKGRSLSIPGTLLISAISVMDDIHKTISMYAKQAGDLLYVVGDTYNELGGSHYYDLLGCIGNRVPKVCPKKAKLIFEALSRASSKGLIRAMHDCSEGGIGVAVAEMAFSGNLGAEIFLSEVPYARNEIARNDFVLFSESNSRFIVEVDNSRKIGFERCLKGLPFGLIGCIGSGQDFKVYGLDGNICVKTKIGELKEAWQKPLRW